MSIINAAITAVGGYLPEDKITNADLEKMVDTNNEWIMTRVGNAGDAQRARGAVIVVEPCEAPTVPVS